MNFNRLNCLTILTVVTLAATCIAPASAASKKVASNAAVSDIMTAFCHLDFNRDGVLDYGEFTATMRGRPGALLRFFGSLDRDRSRTISIFEYAKYQGVRLPASIKPPFICVYPPPRAVYPPFSDDFSRFIGLTIGEAEVLAALEGRPARVIGADGDWYRVTADYNEERINFYLENNRISRVSTG